MFQLGTTGSDVVSLKLVGALTPSFLSIVHTSVKKDAPPFTRSLCTSSVSMALQAAG
jgi:hypothetical protein